MSSLNSRTCDGLPFGTASPPHVDGVESLPRRMPAFPRGAIGVSDRPSVTVRHAIGGQGQPVGFAAHRDPGPEVSIRVTFDLHSHNDALAALDQAVEHVRSQIAPPEDRP